MSAGAVSTSRSVAAWAGVGTLLRFAVRRDRLRLPTWIVGVAGTETLLAVSLVSLYPDEASRAGAALTLGNAGSTAFIGPVYHAHDYHWGIMIGHETLVLAAVAVALMSIFTVVRHTRAEEETGRAELVRAAQVGRHASLAAGVLMSVLSTLVLALVLAGTLIAMDKDQVDAQGAAVFVAAVATVGLVFTGVAAVAAQVASTARAASGMAALALAAGFLVRGAGDVAGNRLTWLSPLGWAQQTYPWAANRWWPLAIGAVAFTILMVLAGWLGIRRDVGEALWARRSGRSSASTPLCSTVGLAVRLNRSAVLGWALAMLTFGLLYGPVLQDAEEFLSQMPVLEEFMPGAAEAGGTRLFASIVVALAALVTAVPAAQVATRLCSDEQAGRTALLLTSSVSRLGWYRATVLVALSGATLILVAFGLGFGLSAMVATDDPTLLGDIVAACLGYLPAVAVVVGVTTLLAGWLPRKVGLAWLVVAHAVVILYFANLLDWPWWVAWPSAFHHVAAGPAATGEAAESIWLTGVAFTLILAGAVGYHRRPID